MAAWLLSSGVATCVEIYINIKWGETYKDTISYVWRLRPLKVCGGEVLLWNSNWTRLVGDLWSFNWRRVAINVDGCIAGRSRTIKPTSKGFKGQIPQITYKKIMEGHLILRHEMHASYSTNYLLKKKMGVHLILCHEAHANPMHP